jgi:hypothetical protein
MIKLFEDFVNESKSEYDMVLKELGDGEWAVRA